MKTPWKQVTTTVGMVTFREILRDKVLYNILLFATLVFGTGFLAASLTHGQPERIVLDFGLSGLAVSCGLIAVLTGSVLLNRELERRTIHLALSRPVSRPSFLIGKYCGLALTIGLNWLLLSLALLIMVTFFASTSETGVAAVLGNPTLFLTLLFLLLQSLALGAMALFFSTFATPSIAVITSFGLYLIGTNLSELRLAAEKMGPSVFALLLKGTATMLPAFERFAPGTRATYGLPFGFLEALGIFAYGILLIAFFLAAAGLMIRKREV